MLTTVYSVLTTPTHTHICVNYSVLTLLKIYKNIQYIYVYNIYIILLYYNYTIIIYNLYIYYTKDTNYIN